MTKIIPSLNVGSEEVKAVIATVMSQAPVKNLTELEVQQALRLQQLREYLKDEKRYSRFAVTVWQDDSRLQSSSDLDRFMALLLDADCREILLVTNRCRYCFGRSPYFWRKVAERCMLSVTASATVEGEYGGRFLGRGWKIAPHIQTLRRWMDENNIVVPTE